MADSTQFPVDLRHRDVGGDVPEQQLPMNVGEASDHIRGFVAEVIPGQMANEGTGFHQEGLNGITAAVNSDSWSRLPVADRDTKFAFRAAIDRLAAHATSIEQFSSWFFWRDPSKPANNRNSYRMPYADVFDDGTVKLVPSAVYSAAAQLSGAHGALPIIPEAEKEQIRRTIERIYAKFRDMWDDPRQVVPWERPDSPPATVSIEASFGEGAAMPIHLVDDEDDNLTASVNSSGWSDLPIADMSRSWDGGAARQRLQAWADGDMAKYRKGFLWYDAANADNVTAYKFPVADVINGRLTIIPRAVNNADARLSSADIPAADKGRIQGILNRIQDRFRGDNEDDNGDDNMTAALAPTRPPAAWFANPNLPGPTRLRVTEEGRVFGHVAAWNSCHRGISDTCIHPPRDASGYREFLTGTTLTAEGTLVRTGHITYGGGHAPLHLGAGAAIKYYDEAGTSVAQVSAGEDAHGIWVAGAMEAGTGDVEAQRLRSHPLSGDWRWMNGRYEMVAALAVNTPGFPIDEPQYALAASGQPLSLVSAGAVSDCDCLVPERETVEQRAEQMRVAEDVRRQRKLLKAELTPRE